MSYLAETLTLPDVNAPDIYDPNDPTSKFYCDGPGVDDPACYDPGGYYGPGGPGSPNGGIVAPESGGIVDPMKGTYTLPVEIFRQILPIMVGRPEAQPMPVPQVLNYPNTATQGTSYLPLLAIGALAFLFLGRKKGR